MDESSKSYEKVPSGIPGFDDLVAGGFHRRTVNTVTGASGTGKTVFASQFIYEGIKNGEKGMIIMPSESAEYLKREMYSSFKWDFWKLEEEGK
ncbi:MAG TPA: ATPase domain-containing protein, partial [Methanothrix sp.]|nr:ATPase domain-containing protein [Methanothrix sp.]